LLQAITCRLTSGTSMHLPPVPSRRMAEAAPAGQRGAGGLAASQHPLGQEEGDALQTRAGASASWAPRHPPGLPGTQGEAPSGRHPEELRPQAHSAPGCGRLATGGKGSPGLGPPPLQPAVQQQQQQGRRQRGRQQRAGGRGQKCLSCLLQVSCFLMLFSRGKALCCGPWNCVGLLATSNLI
jgi:hypothetical protein